LTEAQRQDVLAEARSERFMDRSPEHIVTTLLEERKYYCSIRTLYRLLAEGGETTPRRRQRKHPPYRRPEPMANAPNQTWTWDITLLRGPHRGSYYRLYVVLDLFSRYTVGWLLARTENGSSPPASCATPARRRVSNSLNSSSTPTAALRRLHCPSPIC
jgi:putative transposase